MAIDYRDAFPYRETILGAPVVVTGAVFVEHHRLTTEALPAGMYQIVATLVSQFDSQFDVLQYQYIGTITSPILHVGGDNGGQDDVNSWTAAFPYEHLGGVIDVGLELAAPGQDVNILYSMMAVQKVR